MKLGVYQIRSREFLSKYDPLVIEKPEEKDYSCNVLIWNNNFTFSVESLKHFPNLKLFINWGHEDSNVIDEDALKKQVRIEKVDTWSMHSVAEAVLMYMLRFEREIASVPEELFGKTIGIIGLGKIGFQLGSMLKNSFHCRILYNAKSDHNIPGFEYVSKATLLSTSDYAVILAKTTETLIDESVLAHVHSQLVIVNFSRDHTLPFSSIISLLEKNNLRGFIGDVIKREHFSTIPPNVFIVPKIASRTKQATTLKEQTALFYIKCFESEEKQEKTFLHIVRHGQSTANSQGLFEIDTPLTEKGRSQALSVAETLKSLGIQHIYSSPLKRARETAVIIANTINVDVEIVPSFREMDFGIFGGISRQTIEEIFSDFFERRQINPYAKLYVPYPSGESYYQVYLRILPDLMRILNTHTMPLIVGHESINRMIRGIVTGIKLIEAIQYRQRNDELICIDLSKREENVSRI